MASGMMFHFPTVSFHVGSFPKTLKGQKSYSRVGDNESMVIFPLLAACSLSMNQQLGPLIGASFRNPPSLTPLPYSFSSFFPYSCPVTEHPRRP